MNDVQPDMKPRWQFSIKQLFFMSLFAALLFVTWRYWAYPNSLAVRAFVTGGIGLVLARQLGIAHELSPPGQWLVAGVGFAIIALNAWGWPSERGAFEARHYVEYGWPLPFYISLGGLSFESTRYPLALAVDLAVAAALLFGVLPFAKRLEGSWHLVSPTRQAVMLTFLFGPTALLHVARYAGFPQHLMIAALGLPMVGGIVWAICESSRGLSQLEDDEARQQKEVDL